MKRFWILVVLAAIALPTLALILIPIPHQHQAGAYNIASRLAYCATRGACLHEVGHALDQSAGWISQSPEFHSALQMYLYIELRKPILTELPANILEVTYRGADDNNTVRMEIYAFLFQWCEGDLDRLPEMLRKFYDRDLSARFVELLQPNQSLYWFH